MNPDLRAEKLALAKRKLKEFERQRNSSPLNVHDASGRISAMSNGSVHSVEKIDRPEAEPFTIISAVESEREAGVERNTNCSSSSASSSVVNGCHEDGLHSHPIQASSSSSRVSPSGSAEFLRIVSERDVAKHAYEEVSAQLKELHDHYAQLHSAYSQLSASGAHSGTEAQILQLQSAISVLVEDKTSLLAEIRQLKTMNEDLRQQITSFPVKSKERDLSSSDELEKREALSKLQQANSLLSAQSLELENLRKQWASGKAKLLEVQHERNEAQMRLKMVLKEKDAIEAESMKLRKDLQMKDLHLKQLTVHGSSPQDVINREQQIQKLNADIDAVRVEIQSVRSERDAACRQSDAARIQFETYSRELAEKNSTLSSELIEAQNKITLLERQLTEVETQLQFLHDSGANHGSHSLDSAPTKQGPTGPQDSEAPRPVYSFSEEAFQRKLADEMEKIIISQNNERKNNEFKVEELQRQNEELHLLHNKLKLEMQELKAFESEFSSLSEQLQNEKATVSRAVAQNKELKEQLLETEDRLVTVTNEKMESELARQAAEHRLKQLEDLRVKSSSDDLDSPAVSVSEVAVEAEPLSTTVNELQSLLDVTQRELEEVRAALRRSNTENRQMNELMMNNAEDENQNSIHVELGQALNQLTALAGVNEQLNEQLKQAQITEDHLRLEISRLSHPAESTDRAVDIADCATTPVEKASVHTSPIPYSETAVSVGSEEWAHVELEKRFATAMNRIADLEENVEKLEHINIQLQLENDTIADHVILYQHQRRVIRERLKAKDEQVITLEAERERISRRCRELQDALQQIYMTENLHQNGISTPVQPLGRASMRTYSQSTVDELSGDEEVVSGNEPSPVTDEQFSLAPCDPYRTEEGRCTNSNVEQALQKIMSIVEDINANPNPGVVNISKNIHCSQCTGELMNV